MPDVLVVPRLLRTGSGPTAEFVVLSEPEWRDRPNHRFRTRALAEKYIAWQDERPKARFRHHLIRLYREAVLPFKDWRLPWR